MRPAELQNGRNKRGRLAPVAAGFAALLVLAGCQSAGIGGPPPAAGGTPAAGEAPGLGSRIFGSRAAPSNAPEVDPSYYLLVSQCPKPEIRPGSEVFTVYDRGMDGTPEGVRYQASIRDTARECRQSGGVLTIKVGVAGRVIGGPKGRAGTVTVPLRIALTEDDNTVAFSRLYNVTVQVAAPDLSGEFAQVEEAISVPVPPEGQKLRLYVGFDPGRDNRRR